MKTYKKVKRPRRPAVRKPAGPPPPVISEPSGPGVRPKPAYPTLLDLPSHIVEPPPTAEQKRRDRIALWLGNSERWSRHDRSPKSRDYIRCGQWELRRVGGGYGNSRRGTSWFGILPLIWWVIGIPAQAVLGILAHIAFPLPGALMSWLVLLGWIAGAGFLFWIKDRLLEREDRVAHEALPRACAR